MCLDSCWKSENCETYAQVQFPIAWKHQLHFIKSLYSCTTWKTFRNGEKRFASKMPVFNKWIAYSTRIWNIVFWNWFAKHIAVQMNNVCYWFIVIMKIRQRNWILFEETPRNAFVDLKIIIEMCYQIWFAINKTKLEPNQTKPKQHSFQIRKWNWL